MSEHIGQRFCITNGPAHFNPDWKDGTIQLEVQRHIFDYCISSLMYSTTEKKLIEASTIWTTHGFYYTWVIKQLYIHEVKIENTNIYRVCNHTMDLHLTPSVSHRDTCAKCAILHQTAPQSSHYILLVLRTKGTQDHFAHWKLFPLNNWILALLVGDLKDTLQFCPAVSDTQQSVSWCEWQGGSIPLIRMTSELPVRRSLPAQGPPSS